MQNHPVLITVVIGTYSMYACCIERQIEQ